MKNNHNKLVEAIDALLPQTQCGQCGYSGCLPYAEAMARGEAEINGCPPGGVKTLAALGQLLNRDATLWVADMAAREKSPMMASIRAEECIGCTKCIQACPVDAILGAAKQLHTVLTHACTGCGLCVPPCPVDCIDYFVIEKPAYDPVKARQSFRDRQLRIKKLQAEADAAKKAKHDLQTKRAYVADAVARARAKKSSLSTGSTGPQPSSLPAKPNLSE